MEKDLGIMLVTRRTQEVELTPAGEFLAHHALRAGWVYAVMSIGFALGLFFPPVVQNVSSGMLFLATLTVAWRASLGDIRQSVTMDTAPNASPC